MKIRFFNKETGEDAENIDEDYTFLNADGGVVELIRDTCTFYLEPRKDVGFELIAGDSEDKALAYCKNCAKGQLLIDCRCPFCDDVLWEGED